MVERCRCKEVWLEEQETPYVGSVLEEEPMQKGTISRDKTINISNDSVFMLY